MKKMMPIILVIILVLSGLVAVAVPNYEYIKQDTIEITFSQPFLQVKDQYITVNIDNANSFLMKPNKPLIPSHIYTFKYPLGTKIENVECSPSDIRQQYLPKKILLSPEPIIFAEQLNHEENTVYYENSPYPNTWFEYDVGCGISDNKRCIFVKVEIFPVQYYPSEDLLKVAETFQISVEYKEPNQQTTTFDDEYNLIILSPSKFSSVLNALVTHKIDRGVSTKLVTLDEIYDGSFFPENGRDNQEKIKYFIKNAIETWGTCYVILVGGRDDFPMRYTHVFVDYGNGDSEVFVSDLYYADTHDENGFCDWDSNGNNVFGEYDWGSNHLYDEVDIYPDVYLGRIACVSEAEVETVVDKIITYETYEAYKEEWFSNLVLCGGDTSPESPEDPEDIDEGEYICDIIVELMSGFSSNKLYVTTGALRTTLDIFDAVHEGCGFLVLAGHGNPHSWSTHPHENEDIWIPATGFRSSHASSLINGDKLPILLTDACSPFKYAQCDDCLGWSFVANSKGGTIAGFGCTGLSWGSEGKEVADSLTSKLMIDTFKAYKNQGAITIGEMWAMGLDTYYFPSMDGMEHKSAEEWQLLGDPSLAIAENSQPPDKPTKPEGPNSGKSGNEYTYSSSTIDPDGDRVFYLFDWGDGTDSGWLGPYNSSEICEEVHTWIFDGSYEIKVKAQDFHGVVSEWSDPLAISMPKNKSINTPLLNFFERHLHLLPLLRQMLQI